MWYVKINLKNNTKKNHNYREIIKSVNSLSQTSVNEIITLDVQRTFFEEDIEKKRTVNHY